MRTLTCTLRLWTLITVLAASATTMQAADPTIAWSHTFSTPEGEWLSSDVTLDGLGNVLLAGSTRGNLGGENAGLMDPFLVKLDESGTVLWTRQWGTVDYDRGSDVAADREGNVYVAGNTSDPWPSEAVSYASLSKFDSAGTLLWTEAIDSESYDSATSISLDGLGNAYLAGITGGNLAGDNVGQEDVFLSKFDETGTLLWTQQWGTADRDRAGGVTADGLGNVYISGSTGDGGGHDDGFLSKYDASGVHQWTELVGTDQDDEFYGVRADGVGNVYVTGITHGDLAQPGIANGDAVLGKYDVAGNLLWMQQWNNNDFYRGYSISPDHLGNVYVAGDSTNNGWRYGVPDRKLAFVSKFDDDGMLLWTHEWGSDNDNGNEAWDVAADGLGNFYVSGRFDDEVALTKFTEIEELLGNFDQDDDLTAADINLLSAAVRDGPYNAALDLNLDEFLDEEDRRIWVEDIVGTIFGDANLNKEVGLDDFLALSTAFGLEGGWENGDFDGSGDVQFPDFLLLSANFGKASATPAIVPEPSGSTLLILGVVCLWLRRSRSSDFRGEKAMKLLAFRTSRPGRSPFVRRWPPIGPRCAAAVFSTWFVLTICTSTQAIVTSDGPGTHIVSEMDDTFGLNLDGVVTFGGEFDGRVGTYCAGALITDRHVVTAAHCFDTNGDGRLDPDVFFFPSDVLIESQESNFIAVDFDPAKVKWSDEWETSRSDIAVVTLEANAPSDIPRYALYGGNAEIGQPFVLVGYGYAGYGPTGYDPNSRLPVPRKRAGRNRYDAVIEVDGAQFLVSDFDSGQPEHNSLGDLGFGADEVGTAEFDSGGPGFLQGAVASVVAFGEQFPLVDATEEHDSSWGERDFNTRVSNFQDFILSATDGQAVFVWPDEPSILGDFDNDQLLTAADVDLLSRAIRIGIHHDSFDLNDDDAVDPLDRETWVRDLVGTSFGDANLDQQVDMDDFLALSTAFGSTGGWANGDFDGSGDVQFPDFLRLSANFGQSAIAPTAVPEPSGFCLALFVGLVLIRIGRNSVAH